MLSNQDCKACMSATPDQSILVSVLSTIGPPALTASSISLYCLYRFGISSGLLTAASTTTFTASFPPISSTLVIVLIAWSEFFAVIATSIAVDNVSPSIPAATSVLVNSDVCAMPFSLTIRLRSAANLLSFFAAESSKATAVAGSISPVPINAAILILNCVFSGFVRSSAPS